MEMSEALGVLLSACPSFTERWNSLTESEDDLLPYVVAGEFANHLLDLYLCKDTSEFPAVGKAIELLHVDGSEPVQTLATVGILEGIQNVWGNRGANPELFGTWLGPVSRRAWDQLNDFWKVVAGSSPKGT